ncbi:MAG: VWA domain-containing protein [Bryobacteraceae bacterium]
MALLAALAILGLAMAQSVAPDEAHARTVPYVPPPKVTIRTEVDVVEVPVVVRDGQHRAVAGLTKNNFEVYDTGVRQTITAFSEQHFTSQADAGSGTKPAIVAAAPAGAAEPKDEPRPRYLALCFDDLNMDPLALKPVKEAAERFVKTALAPGDRVAVVTVAQQQDYEFTGDVPTLAEQIAKVTSHRRSTDDSVQQCLRIRPYEAYLIANRMDDELLKAKTGECSACYHAPCPPNQVTSVSEAIWEHSLSNSKNTLRVLGGLVDGMAKLPGERMILLTSRGFLTGNLEADEDLLMAKALHAGVVINTLDAKGLSVIIPTGDASAPAGWVLPSERVVETKNAERVAQAQDDGMAVLASGTGGAFYHNNNDLAHGFRVLGMVPETMYVLGFSPSGVAADGRFHSLKVRLAADKRYSLQARLGYAASSASAAVPSSPLSKLDSEAMASDTLADLPIRFTWEQWAGPPGITMVAHLDLDRLHFEIRQGRRGQKLALVGVLRDSRGGFVMGKRSELDLNLTDATFAQLTKAGFTVSMTLEAPPGSYSARGVAQDALEGKLAAASGAIEVKAIVEPPLAARPPR